MPFSYTEVFERECPRYMAWGMGLDEYWNGDNERVIYYRKKHEIEVEEYNQRAWLQGFYIYSAMGDMFPLYNALCSKHEAFPYMSDPIPLSKEEADRREEELHRKQIEAGREAMMEAMARINTQFKRKQKGGEENVTDK